jgi:hypothetical protein
VYSNKKSGLGKKAIVVSPQSWGKMFISKHHYAVELAKLDYEVFFVNPPNEKKLGGFPNIKINATEYENLLTVNHTIFFSSYFKFHIPFLHHILIFIHRRLLLKKIGKPDLILSFDLTNNFPLTGLACKKIFFAADEPRNNQNYVSAMNSDLIVSVSQHIIDLYRNKFPSTKTLLINHGLSDEFINFPIDSIEKYSGINIGLSGNFLFNDIDYTILLKIIQENPNVNFHFYGNNTNQCNLGSENNEEIYNFLDQIKINENAIFHGIMQKKELSIELNKMDAFLICYKVEMGQSSGSNSHKILEFLSTGKLIISTNFSFYSKTNLFIQLECRNSNNGLVKLFKEGIANLDRLNSIEMNQKRKGFAYENSYFKNAIKILEG